MLASYFQSSSNQGQRMFISAHIIKLLIFAADSIQHWILLLLPHKVFVVIDKHILLVMIVMTYKL